MSLPRRIAAVAYDRRRAVLGAWIALIAAGALLAGAVGSGYVNSFALPGTESQHALDTLQREFPQAAGDSDQIVFHARRGTLRDGPARAQIAQVLTRVDRQPEVTGTISPFTQPGAVSRDGRTAFATLQFSKQAADLTNSQIDQVIDTARAGQSPSLQVELGGQAIEQSEQPKTGADEVIGIAVAVLVLLIVLGSATAMAMPLLGAFAAIGAASGLTYAATGAFQIAPFAPTLAVMISLGVGIDYALLIVNRFRAQRAEGSAQREATLEAMDTAGRSVLFAGATVVIALCGMLLLGVTFLNGPALAAALAVVLTVASAWTLLPAMLGFLGHRVKVPQLGEDGGEPRLWARWSARNERHPVRMATGAILLLLVVAIPVTHMRLATADATTDPTSKTTRRADDLLTKGFGPGYNGPLLVVSELGSDKTAAKREVGTLRTALTKAPGVTAVSAPQASPNGKAATLSVIPSSSPQAAATTDLVKHLREDVVPQVRRSAPQLRSVSIGGATASNVDFGDTLSSKLPVFIGAVLALSLLLMTVVFRSVVIPVKAAAMNLLSIGTSLGVITFVFQDGHLQSLLGIEGTSPIEPYLPVFLFAIIFGLSTDYEVFLVGRMHEEWQASRDHRYAVRHALALTGRVVMAAAIIMVSVFGSFVLGDDHLIKLFGLGLATAILFDAFVIRLVLVPSLMHLFGRASWWLPDVLERRLPRLSLEGPPPAES